MQVMFDIPDSYSFLVPTSKDTSYTVDCTKLSQAVFAAIFQNGVKQKVGDSVADPKKFPTLAEKVAGVESTIKGFTKGTGAANGEAV